MEMKRKIGIAISLCMVVILLIGCTAGENVDGTGSNPTENAATQPAENTEPAEVEQMCKVNTNPLSDVRVRQAIAYAIDMDAIAENFFGGMVTPADSLTPDNGLGLNAYSYNPEKAKELLADAGWDSNYVLKVVYTYTDQQTVDFLAIVQQYLGEVGIKMNATLLEGNTSAALWTKPEDPVNGPSAVDWDIYYGAIGASSQYAFYGRFQTAGSNNSHTPGNDELDALIAAVYSTVDPDKQTELFNQIQVFMNKQLPVLPLYHMEVYTIESDRVNRNGAPYGNEQYCYDWRIETWDVVANSEGEKILHTNGAPAEYFWDTFANANGNPANKMLFDHLLVANGDCDEFAGQQAETYAVSDDGLSISFTLKDGLKWHDGSALTANDVKFTWELAARVAALNNLYTDMVKKFVGYQDYVDGVADEIEGIVIDGNVITFNFAEVAPTALLGFSQLPTLPKAYLIDIDPSAVQQYNYWQSPVGSGPFKIKEVSMNNYTILEAFAEYHEGRPLIDQVYMYPSTETDANLVKNVTAGLYDYAWSKTLSDAEACSKVNGYTVTAYPMLYSRLLYFNKFEHVD